MEENNKKIQAIEKLYEENGKLLMDLCYKADIYYRNYFPTKDLAETGMDIVHEIVAAMILGDRKWDVDKYQDAYNQVIYYMKSEIRNLQSREMKLLDSVDINSEEINDIMLTNKKTKILPDENLEQREIKDMFKKCIEHIRGLGIQLHSDVFEGMYYGKTSKELAAENRLEVSEIENVKRKIKARLHEKFPEYRIKF